MYESITRYIDAFDDWEDVNGLVSRCLRRLRELDHKKGR